MNVLIFTDESQRTPYMEEMDGKSSSIFSLSCYLNCKFVNLIRSLILYTKRTHKELSFDIPKGFIEQLHIYIMRFK